MGARWLGLLLLIAVAGCGGDAGSGADLGADLAAPADLGAGVDLATGDLRDLAAGVDAAEDLSAAPDLALVPDAAGDDALAIDAGGPDFARCNAFGGSGVPTVLSGTTAPAISAPLAATDGSSTMVVWTVSPDYSYNQGVHGAWARLSGGAVAEHGDLTGDTRSAQLLVLGGKFYLFSARSLYRFESGAWSQVTGFAADVVSVSGARLLGLSGSLAANGVTATLYDGTTVGSATKISDFRLGAVAPDGSNGFGVFTVDQSSSTNVIHFLTFDGSAWSSESTVGTQTLSIGGYYGFMAAHTGSLWAAAYVTADLSTGYSPTAWVLANGTWSSSSFAGRGPSVFLAGNNGTFALAGSGGWAAVYASGSWTQRSGSTIGKALGLVAFQTGYVTFFGGFGGSDPFRAAVFDGATWSADTTISASANYGIRVTASSSVAAVSFPEPDAGGVLIPKVASYGAGAWSATYSLGPGSSGATEVVASGSDLTAFYPEAGALRSRARTSGTWSAAQALPNLALSGGVQRSSSLVRAGNGHALALWSQFDADQAYPYAAEWDGATWHAPVRLAAGWTVAANGTSFVVGWTTKGASPMHTVATWTGTGLSTPVSLAAVTNSPGVSLASDGASFVAVWNDGNGINAPDLWSSSSADGVTWTTPQKVQASAGNVQGVVGGPAGVLVWTSPFSSSVTARVWQSGAWGTPASFNSSSTIPCQGAVASTSALLACTTSTIDAKLFSGGAWTAQTIGLADYALSVGSDGTDYRIDYTYSGNPPHSRVLHAGTWSAPVDNSGFYISNSGATTAGACGAWVFANSSGTQISRAAGAAAYSATTTLAAQKPFRLSLVQWPGATDAFWAAPTATSNGSSVMYVALGL